MFPFWKKLKYLGLIPSKHSPESLACEAAMIKILFLKSASLPENSSFSLKVKQYPKKQNLVLILM